MMRRVADAAWIFHRAEPRPDRHRRRVSSSPCRTTSSVGAILRIPCQTDSRVRDTDTENALLSFYEIHRQMWRMN